MPLVRVLTADDVAALQPLDHDYALRSGCEDIVDIGSISFYSRSGHSFVMEEAGRIRGFLLGQAVWDGRRPTVRVRRVVSDVAGGREALLEALTKSAYDAGVYDIVVEQPEADGEGSATLAASNFEPRSVRLYQRLLGSRSRDG